MLTTIIKLFAAKLKSIKGQIKFFLSSAKSVKIVVGSSIAFVFLVSAFSIIQLKKFNTQYSLEQFFPKEHGLLAKSLKNRQTFQLEDSASFLVLLKLKDSQKTWLDPEPLRQLKQLTEKISSQGTVNSALSAATLEGAIDEGKNLVVGPLFQRMKPQKWKDFALSNPLILNQLLSEDFRSAMIQVEPANLSVSELAQLSKKLRSLTTAAVPDADVFIGGIPAIQAELSDQLLEEFKLFSILSLVVFGLVFYILFQGYQVLLLSLLSLGFVNLAAVGLVCFLKVPFSLLLSTLPIVVSVAMISILIHTLHRWSEVSDHRFTSSLKVLGEMFKANFLGSLTTALGFLVLSVTPIPLISQYGWVVALCVISTWVLTQVLLFGFMHLSRPQLRHWMPQKATWMLIFFKYPKTLLVLILLVVAASGAVGINANFSSRLFDDLPKNKSSRMATEMIDRDFGGIVSADFTLQSKKAGYWKNPDNLKRLHQVIKSLRQVPEVGSVLSPYDFFQDKVPKSSQAMAEFLFLYSLAEKNPLKHFLTDDGKKLRIAVRFHDRESRQIQKAQAKILKKLKREFTSLQIDETGIAKSSHTINQEVSKSLIFNFWHAILVVGLVLVFVFKSMRWALVACLPNLIPPAVLIGGLSIMQTPIKPAIALIFSIALGLAFNNTVYYLSRLQSMFQASDGRRLPVEEALLQEGHPCLFETLIMILGFSIFLTSQFDLNMTFGIYMLLSLVAGAIGDLIFLPLILKIYPRLILKG
jgi:predicted RND superfamily exporter protein